MSGRKCISILSWPSPLHASQRPPATLNGSARPRTRAALGAGSLELADVIATPVRGRVAARGAPDGGLVDVDDLVDESTPSSERNLPTRLRVRMTWLESAGAKVSVTSELLPDPLTPVTTVSVPISTCTLMFLRLLARAPLS